MFFLNFDLVKGGGEGFSPLSPSLVAPLGRGLLRESGSGFLSRRRVLGVWMLLPQPPEARGWAIFAIF